MPTHTISQVLRVSDSQYSVEASVTDDEEIHVDVTLAALASEVAVDPVTLTNSKVKSLMLTCTGDCTIKTNSSSSPGNTKVLAAGEVVLWAGAAAPTANPSATIVIGTNPFVSADVTKLYLSSTAGGVFTLRAIINAA